MSNLELSRANEKGFSTQLFVIPSTRSIVRGRHLSYFKSGFVAGCSAFDHRWLEPQCYWKHRQVGSSFGIQVQHSPFRGLGCPCWPTGYEPELYCHRKLASTARARTRRITPPSAPFCFLRPPSASFASFCQAATGEFFNSCRHRLSSHVPCAQHSPD